MNLPRTDRLCEAYHRGMATANALSEALGEPTPASQPGRKLVERKCHAHTIESHTSSWQPQDRLSTVNFRAEC